MFNIEGHIWLNCGRGLSLIQTCFPFYLNENMRGHSSNVLLTDSAIYMESYKTNPHWASGCYIFCVCIYVQTTCSPRLHSVCLIIEDLVYTNTQCEWKHLYSLHLLLKLYITNHMMKLGDNSQFCRLLFLQCTRKFMYVTHLNKSCRKNTKQDKLTFQS